MSLVTRTYTFTDGTTAYGSQVDSEIANIVNTLNSLDQAGITWTNVKVTTLLPQTAINMGGLKITSLANGTVSGDAVNYGQLSAIPGAVTGALLFYPLKASPSGYLYCNGAAVSRGTYATLYGIVGNIFGSGDGSTTFNLPDYRGKFIRGVNDASGNDPDASSRTAQASGGNTGDQAGSIQADQFKSHTHTVTDTGHAHTEQYGTGGGSAQGVQGAAPAQAGVNNVSTNTTVSATTGVTNQSTGGNESRPINSAIYVHIKI